MFGYEFVSKVQIVAYQFVRKMIAEKKSEVWKKGVPFDPQVRGNTLNQY